MGEGGGRGCQPPSGVLLSFFLDDKTPAPDVFSSFSFIPCAHFETSSVMASFYGYEIGPRAIIEQRGSLPVTPLGSHYEPQRSGS